MIDIVITWQTREVSPYPLLRADWLAHYKRVAKGTTSERNAFNLNKITSLKDVPFLSNIKPHSIAQAYEGI